MSQNKNSYSCVFPWVVWGLGALFCFYEFLLQVSPGVMVPDLMRAFSANATGLSYLAAAYFYAYAGMQIPVGVLLDRFGSRRLLTLACIICAVGCVVFSMAHTLPMGIFGRTFIGFGSSFAIVGCLNLAARWFPPQRFAFLMGLLLAVGMSGAIGGGAPLAFMVSNLGWRHSVLIFSVVGVLLAVVIWLVVRDHPPEHKQVMSQHQAPLLTGLKAVLRSRQSWLSAIYGGLMYAPTPMICALWGVPYLMRAYGFTRPVAAGIISIIFVGWAVGSPFFGWYSDFIGRRKPIMTIAAVVALISIIGVIYLPNLNAPILIILFFVFGFFSGGFAVSFSLTREINPSRYSATSLGFMNMINMFGCAVVQPVVGVILDYFWNGSMQDGARVYSIGAYHLALTIIPVLMFIALMLIPFIKETYCEPIDGGI
jgi:MFS family permease